MVWLGINPAIWWDGGIEAKGAKTQSNAHILTFSFKHSEHESLQQLSIDSHNRYNSHFASVKPNDLVLILTQQLPSNTEFSVSEWG